MHKLAPRVVLLVLGFAVPAQAQQVFETVGERALGMGGAFVAVADDATAVHWNPAGLVGAGPAAMTIGWQRFQSGNRKAVPYPGPDLSTGSLTSLGTYPLGVSYGHFRSSALVDDGAGGVRATTLSTSQIGVTLLQSVVDGLVVGSTINYIRGGEAFGLAEGATVASALSSAAGWKVDRRGTVDLDLGVMADMRKVRVGLTWKNLRSPSFGEIAGPANTLPRHARMGVAVLPTTGLTLAMDMDLDTVDLRDGLRRMIAVGGESRLSRRLALRSGVRWSLEGTRRPVGAAGISVGVRKGLWLDAHYAQGRVGEARELGVALRAGY